MHPKLVHLCSHVYKARIIYWFTHCQGGLFICLSVFPFILCILFHVTHTHTHSAVRHLSVHATQLTSYSTCQRSSDRRGLKYYPNIYVCRSVAYSLVAPSRGSGTTPVRFPMLTGPETVTGSGSPTTTSPAWPPRSTVYLFINYHQARPLILLWRQ